jgi:exoribonuclease-2
VTYALFDDAGKLLAGRLMSEADSSVQIELDSGKRLKVKLAHVLLRFDSPAPAVLLAAARARATEIDLDLAWEFAPDTDFGFADLARDYFDAKAGATEQAAALIRLAEAPHYFRRIAKGVFRKAPEETVKAALMAIARKERVQTQIDDWAAELVAGTCPAAVVDQLYRILFKPDKNAPEYKAVVEASRRSQQSPLDLLKRAGAIASPYQFHWRRFLFDQFPRGTGFAPTIAPAVGDELPLVEIDAFSIDDSQTTEIDDALSVRGLGSGKVCFGIHIAAPALAVQPGSAIDQIARERLSTVYMPGWKLTMLPDAVISEYTLIEGRACPAVSLYVEFDEASLAVLSTETRIERVTIAANLRHDQLDAVITEAALVGDEPCDHRFISELAFAHRLALHLKAGREVIRGKPENFNRPDYNFRLTGNDAEPDGSERVQITLRRRGAPLDLIVSEAMILANSHWGGWIAECGVPGIYRSQVSLAPGNKVRMGTRAQPHAGMGVAQYTWATSPLRRYVDLVNQWQIIASARHGRTAALAAPFRPKDATLFSIISSFEGAYSAYNDFQQAIERYWTLRWIEQEGITELDAAVIKDGLVRVDALPLVVRVPGCDALPRGSRVRVRIAGCDLLTLDLHATLVGPIADAAAAAPNVADDDADLDDAAAAGTGLQLAIDVGDAGTPASDDAVVVAEP